MVFPLPVWALSAGAFGLMRSAEGGVYQRSAPALPWASPTGLGPGREVDTSLVCTEVGLVRVMRRGLIALIRKPRVMNVSPGLSVGPAAASFCIRFQGTGPTRNEMSLHVA